MPTSISKPDRLTRHEKRHIRAERIHIHRPGRKHLYRVKAHDQKGKVIFFKTFTKQKMASIKRIATMRGLLIDRISN